MARTLVQDVSASSSAPVRLVAQDDPAIPAGAEGLVHVKFLASPVNRVDLMVLSGQYPVKPQNTQDAAPIPGFDGCAVVTRSSSARFAEGDLVIPKGLGLGTWRTHAVVPDASLLRLPAATPVLGAALLRSGALIAWLLLEAVRPLQKGDSIIMSAGTSSVAHFLVQLARLREISVALVIRDRPSDAAEAAKKSLLSIGAAGVLTETELAEGTVPLPLPNKPVLALDCVYGRIGQILADALAPQGTFALVGLLSGPGSFISVSTGHLFTKQLSFVPFRGSEVLKRMGESKAEELVSHIAGLLKEGKLQVPQLNLVSWQQESDPELLSMELQQVLEKAKKDEVGSKKTVWMFS